MFFDDIDKYETNVALIDDNNNSITYEELCKYSDLLKEKINSRKLCLVLCKNSLGLVVGYVSFMRNRVVPIMVDVSIDKMLLYNIINTYQPAYVYAPSDNHKINGYNSIMKIYDYELYESEAAHEVFMYPDLALLLTTSGTTGSPKFVRQSYKNIEANTKSICEYLIINSNEIAVTTLPMNYTYGLSVLQTHLMVGAKIVITEKTVINKEFWDLVKAYKVTSIAGVPYTYQMLKKVKFMKFDLPCLKTLTQAGGKLPITLHKEFGEYALANNKRFVVMYGQTEATARMAYLPYERCLDKSGSIGISIPGGKLELVDNDDQIVTLTDVEGELVYYGDNVTLGYAQTKEDLSLGDINHGILKTGDLAKKDNDGFFYITGRKKRFIKMYGSRINLDEIEQLAKNKFTEIDCACVGKDDYLSLYITDLNLIDECRTYLLKLLKITAVAFEVVYINEIPKNSSGKTNYKVLDGRNEK